MTSAPIYDVPIDFEQLEGFTPLIKPMAPGVRASMLGECPACAIIAGLDPDDPRVFDAFRTGVGTLGHLLHQAWAFQSFHGKVAYELEAPIPWVHGVSHDDVLIETSAYAGLYEVKTHSEKQPTKPSRSNIVQTKIRRRLRELHGLAVPGPSYIVMIGKAGNEGGIARLGATVTLDDDDRAGIDAMLELVDECMARAASIDLGIDKDRNELVDPGLRALAQGCRRCCPMPVLTADDDQEQLLAAAAEAKAANDAAKAAKKIADDAAKAAKKAYEDARALLKPVVPEAAALAAADGTKATIDRRGALVINAG